MTILDDLAEELTNRARQAADPFERGLTSIAAAIARGFAAHAHELRVLSVGTETISPGAIESLAISAREIAEALSGATFDPLGR